MTRRPRGRRSSFYILDDDGRPTPVEDALAWARWFERASEDGSRIVAQTKIGAVLISTVFLGLDHQVRDDGPPMLYETMTFGGSRDQQTEFRYATREEAERGHAFAVSVARRDLRKQTGRTGDPRKRANGDQ